MADEQTDAAETTAPKKTTARKIVLTPVVDTVVGTVQYVTEAEPGKFVTELLPADAEIDDQFLCAADGNIYKVSALATDTDPIYLVLVGPQKKRLVEPWDGTEPAGGEDARDVSKYPDASYFAVGPIGIDPLKDVTLGTADNTEPYYAYIDGEGLVKKVAAKDLSPRPGEVYFEAGTGYDLISNVDVAGVTAAKAGDAPGDISALFERQAEYGVPSIDAYSDEQKTELLKFYNILDADGNLTQQGAVLETRILMTAADITTAVVASKEETQLIATPTPGGTEVTYKVIDGSVVFYKDPDKGEDGWDGASDDWTTGEFPQFVDFSTGTNQSTGFYPGRK